MCRSTQRKAFDIHEARCINRLAELFDEQMLDVVWWALWNTGNEGGGLRDMPPGHCRRDCRSKA
jgi:hypothetical protein